MHVGFHRDMCGRELFTNQKCAFSSDDIINMNVRYRDIYNRIYELVTCFSFVKEALHYSKVSLQSTYKYLCKKLGGVKQT